MNKYQTAGYVIDDGQNIEGFKKAFAEMNDLLAKQNGILVSTQVIEMRDCSIVLFVFEEHNEDE